MLNAHGGVWARLSRASIHLENLEVVHTSLGPYDQREQEHNVWHPGLSGILVKKETDLHQIQEGGTGVRKSDKATLLVWHPRHAFIHTPERHTMFSS